MAKKKKIVTPEDIIDHPDFENIFENGQLKGLIHYESYEPSPSFFGAYYGYIQNL
jgi:hypothetical protein